ncbi:hypothetical protein BDFG_06530 [Blastomyces dermatitidis ATCC 26199]|nr:hypothetical protein BDFG_06530 [Blastomyces dermatitidis ATCC 26199]
MTAHIRHIQVQVFSILSSIECRDHEMRKKDMRREEGCWAHQPQLHGAQVHHISWLHVMVWTDWAIPIEEHENMRERGLRESNKNIADDGRLSRNFICRALGREMRHDLLDKLVDDGEEHEDAKHLVLKTLDDVGGDTSSQTSQYRCVIRRSTDDVQHPFSAEDDRCGQIEVAASLKKENSIESLQEHGRRVVHAQWTLKELYKGLAVLLQFFEEVKNSPGCFENRALKSVLFAHRSHGNCSLPSPKLDILAPFGRSTTEKSLFGKYITTGYYVGLVKNSSMPDNALVHNAAADNIKFQQVHPTVPLSDDAVKADIIKAIKQPPNKNPAKFPPGEPELVTFSSHAPYSLQGRKEDAPDRSCVEGARH